MPAHPGPGIAPEHAAVFAKIGFLNSVGFLTDLTYARCLGHPAYPVSDAGVFTYADGNLISEYRESTRAGLDLSGHSVVFWLTASGADSDGDPAEASLRVDVKPVPSGSHDPSMGVPTQDISLEDAPFPRGLHFIGERYGPLGRYRVRTRTTRSSTTSRPLCC